MTRRKIPEPNKEAEWEYAAEERAMPFLDGPHTLAESTAWINAALASEWWREHGFPTQIRIRGGRDKIYCYYSNRGIISLNRGARYSSKQIILHELAHFICDKIRPFDSGHGKHFMFRLLQLVEHYIGKAERDRLEFEFNRTPQDLAAEKAKREARLNDPHNWQSVASRHRRQAKKGKNDK